MSKVDTATSGEHVDCIRSFVLRASRATAGQQCAIEELDPQFLLSFKEVQLDLVVAVGDSTKSKILEISFGISRLPPKFQHYTQMMISWELKSIH